MESLITFACEQSHNAHWFLFFLIMIAGLNIPISEDIILITGGAIASTCLEDHWLRLYLWLFFACWFSAWEAYWIGRLLGPKLYDIRWFNRVLTLKRIERLHAFYERFGIITFLVGRFIPGGVRNALFMTSGMGKMPFHKFILRDLPACFLSVTALFYLGFLFGQNYQVIVSYFYTYQTIILSLLALLVVGFLIMNYSSRKLKSHSK